MRKALLTLTAVMTLTALGGVAHAGSYIIYLQGRGWAAWDGETVSSGWTNVTLSFNGNARLDGPETNTTVKNALNTYCKNGNVCIVHCYSAGCLRMVKATYDSGGASALTGLQYVESAGSAAGGTKLAEMSTSGGTKFIAKIIGQQEKVDFDLTPGAARNTWGYTQASISPKWMYMVAGKYDICKSLLFFKVCGNTYVNSGYSGAVGDGVVSMDSSGGYSTQGSYSTGWLNGSATYGKYAGRRYEDSGYMVGGVDQTAATGTPKDHFGIAGTVTAIIGTDITGTGYDRKQAYSDSTSQSACSGTACDDKFTSQTQNYSKLVDGTSISTSVASTSSNTTAFNTNGATCAGKCGTYSIPGASCHCDSACVGRGDCCSDYNNSQINCPSVW
jgi:hypothetical protein